MFFMMTTHNTSMTTTRYRYEQALFAMKQARKSMMELQEAYQEELARDYPLDSLIGKSVYYSRAKWGDFDEHYKHFVLDAENSHAYSYLKAHLIISGDEANRQFDTFRFHGQKEYLLYVLYDNDLCFDDEYKEHALSEWPLYEFMIIEL